MDSAPEAVGSWWRPAWSKITRANPENDHESQPPDAYVCFVAAVVAGCLALAEGPPYLANGVKVGEVDQTSAIVWSRLSASADCDPETFFIPGTAGEARVAYWPENDNERTVTTPWTANVPADGYTCQVRLGGLSPGTAYRFRFDARAGGGTNSLEGRFKTAPAVDDPAAVTFAVVTCQDFKRQDDGAAGHRIYKTMLEHPPDFFVHTGDIVYYDRLNPFAARTVDQARAHWHRMYRYTLAQRKPQHRYLNIRGGFFLGAVGRQGGRVVFTARHFSPTGELRHVETLARP